MLQRLATQAEAAAALEEPPWKAEKGIRLGEARDEVNRAFLVLVAKGYKKRKLSLIAFIAENQFMFMRFDYLPLANGSK